MKLKRDKINYFGAETDREGKEKGTCGSHLKKKDEKKNEATDRRAWEERD